MATIFETHFIPFQKDIEILENQIQVIRSFTRNPKVPFTIDLYLKVYQEAHKSLLNEVKSTYAKELTGKELVDDAKIFVKPFKGMLTGILTIKYIFQ